MERFLDIGAWLIGLNARIWPGLTIGLVLAVSYLTLTPIPDLDMPVIRNDKVQHILAFGAIVFPVALARPRHWLGIVALVALWGGMIEVIQTFVGRHGSIADVFANTAGILISIGTATIVRALFDPAERRAAE